MAGYTSERVSPDHYGATIEDRLIYLLHEKTYRFAAGFVEDKDVLDFGCGDGYGTSLLASRARSIAGVDVDGPAIELARRKYAAPGLRFSHVDRGDLRIPGIDTASVDVTLSFQVVEHVEDVSRYLAEIHRVLRKGGRFLLTTPNAASRLLPFQNPWNKHHLREYTDEALVRTLSPVFHVDNVFGLTYTPEWLPVETRRVTRNKWVLWAVSNRLVPTSLRQRLLHATWRMARRGRARSERMTGSVPTIDDVLVTSESIAESPSLLLVCTKT